MSILKNQKKLNYDYIGTDNKNHKYFPDIYIPSRNLILEVKSIRTIKLENWHTLSENDISDTNLLKRESVLKSGYNFWFVVI